MEESSRQRFPWRRWLMLAAAVACSAGGSAGSAHTVQFPQHEPQAAIVVLTQGKSIWHVLHCQGFQWGLEHTPEVSDAIGLPSWMKAVSLSWALCTPWLPFWWKAQWSSLVQVTAKTLPWQGLPPSAFPRALRPHWHSCSCTTQKMLPHWATTQPSQSSEHKCHGILKLLILWYSTYVGNTKQSFPIYFFCFLVV